MNYKGEVRLAASLHLILLYLFYHGLDIFPYLHEILVKYALPFLL